MNYYERLVLRNRNEGNERLWKVIKPRLFMSWMDKSLFILCVIFTVILFIDIIRPSWIDRALVWLFKL